MQNFETQQDEQLWQLAKKRAAFKKSVITTAPRAAAAPGPPGCAAGRRG